MEYGEAITTGAFEHAVAIARRRRAERHEPLDQVAAEAVAGAYCVCVTEGEDAAERRLSDVHRNLIRHVADRVRALEASSSTELGKEKRPWH